MPDYVNLFSKIERWDRAPRNGVRLENYSCPMTSRPGSRPSSSTTSSLPNYNPTTRSTLRQTTPPAVPIILATDR